MNKDLKNVIIVVAILLGLLIIGSLFGGFIGWERFGGMMGGFGLAGMGIGLVLMVAFWALVIWAIVSFIRWLASTSGPGGHVSSASPLEILKQRYARGEINKEEFEQKKKDLGG